MSLPRLWGRDIKPWAWILAGCLILTAAPAGAQTGKASRPGKLTQTLIDLQQQQEARAAGLSAAPLRPASPLAKLVEERVVINAVAEDDAGTLKADLEALGMQNAAVFGRMVSGQLPVSAIGAAAGLRSLRFARESAATTRAGSVSSQGDAAMKSNAARTTFGVDGTGVTVGVLSDSFNCKGGATGDVNSGDLSTVNVVQDLTQGQCSSFNGTDEGRAMLQIAHDVAPGASLAFATAFVSEASFANNILALKNAGAKVIVDDVFYYDEPMFQDGIIAQAVDSVVAGGAAYFSAAGNEARQSYQKAFKAGTSFNDGDFSSAAGAPHFFGGVAHNFASSGTDVFQSLTIPAHTTLTFSVQWDSPFASAGPGPGSPNDLDVYIFNSAATQVIGGATTENLGGDAVEVFSFLNSGNAPLNVNLMIVKYVPPQQNPPNPGLIKYVYFGSMTVNEYATNSSTIYGHANAAGAEAVGAAFYADTPQFGQTPPLLESYSSLGGTPILFTTSGNPTNDPRADKPEITAPDGGNTTFFFPGDDVELDGHPNFFGTSAAAPHAGGVAALLLQADPSLSPDNVYSALENSAIDMGTAGFDNASGFGLIQADAALGSLSSGLDLAVTQSDAPDPVVVGNNVTYTISVNNKSLFDATGVTLTDSLPGSVNLISATPSQGSCNGTTAITCNLGGLLNHATATVTIVAATTITGQLSNTASVAANEDDVNPANDSATQNTSVIPPPLAIGATALPEGEVGAAYSAGLQISGGSPGYNVTLLSGTLPAGLVLDHSTGAITGTPTKANNKKPASFTLKVTDGASATISRTFTLAVYPVLVNSAKSLKSGKVGKSYSVILKAKGGKAPYTWSIMSGSLPAGLNFSAAGSITGIPGGAAGPYGVAIEVTDALGNAVPKNLTLNLQ